MHLFVYDSLLSQKNYQKTVLKLDSTIPSLNLEARIVRLSFLKDVREVVPDGVKRGYSTIVCVGNDQTLSKVLNSLPVFENITLGIIPIQGSGENLIASALGIEDMESALLYVQKRIIARVDVGKINNHFFLSRLILNEKRVDVWCEDKFNLKSLNPQNQICLYNIFNASPSDGLLEIGLEFKNSSSLINRVRFLLQKNPEQYNPTRVPIKRARVIVPEKESFVTIADQRIIIKNPATVEVLPQTLRIIVGKNILK